MVLLIDNYDSFTHNLARDVAELGAAVEVVRNDAVTADDVAAMRPDAVILSPGPCTPAEAGVCVDLVRRADPRLPILGVCLGHQAIAAACGGAVVRGEPMHGVASDVVHDGTGLFAGLPDPLACGRYHSLVVADRPDTPLPDDLRVTARTADGTVMALAHRTRPVFGVQFHPESILTPRGRSVTANFLSLAGVPVTGGDFVRTAGTVEPGPRDEVTAALTAYW